MSYDLYLNDRVTGETLVTDAPHQMRGGTYQIGGSTELWLNVTYNYTPFYKREEVFGEHGLEALDGLTGAESIPLLERGIRALGDNVSKDYWEATEGNAKRALYQLLAMAQMRPDGIWEVI